MPTPLHLADPPISLEERDGETTLLINGDQAMQAWEIDLMHAGADAMLEFGDEYLEVGLGLGLSALRIAERARQHTVIEVYSQVIDLFNERHPDAPESLKIVQGDFIDVVVDMPDAMFDGIFFDPAFEKGAWEDVAFMQEAGKQMHRLLRPGGSFIPFFSTTLCLWEHWAPLFDRLDIRKMPYRAYPTTSYTVGGVEGTAWIHRYVKAG